MDKKIKGSWLIHHTNKLQGFTAQTGHENTFLAGKAGILLSAISANDQIIITDKRLKTLAKAASINVTFELPKLLEVLSERGLLEQTGGEIALLGLTTPKTLEHTADIFSSLQPSAAEEATIALAEEASNQPVTEGEATEQLGDLFHLAKTEVKSVLTDAENFGFIDIEAIPGGEKLLFNGNLFRRESTKKIKAVLDSLSQADQSRLTELTAILRQKACVPVDVAQNMLGTPLFEKVTSVGLLDVNVVANSAEAVGFITLPSAFSKFSSSMVEDAFDLTKAFVSSITYGMTKSYHQRGQITMVDKLLAALVRGEPIGPVPAIGEDYKVLELKGVVKIQDGSKNGRFGPMMTLLKKEVGELARQAIRQGDISEHSLTALPSAAVTRFDGPEHNREKTRRKQVKLSPKATNDMLSILRTGGGI